MKIKNRQLLAIIMGVLLGSQTLAVQAAPDSSVIQELSQRLDALGKEVNQLRGENERLNYEIGRLRQNQKKGFMAIDERLEKYQPKGTAKPSVQQPAASAKVAQPAQPRPAVVNAGGKTPPAPVKKVAKIVAPTKAVAKISKKPAGHSEKADYNHAYQTLKGNRDAGIREFLAFLKRYPTSRLAENAHYWIGEAQYAKKNYNAAIDSFVIVLNKYKSGRKAPDAAVKLGYSFYALKDWTMARRTFNDVLRYFPRTNAAKLARSRLDRMVKEGH